MPPARLRRDPRVAPSLSAGGQNEMGLAHYLVVYGSDCHDPNVAAAAGQSAHVIRVTREDD